MSKQITYNRRHFLGNAFATFGAIELASIGIGVKQFSNRNSIKAMLNGGIMKATFNQMKQIDAGVLNVSYAEAGPAKGPVVILLHGWPYDIHSFVDVTPLLTSAGYRVVIPY